MKANIAKDLEPLAAPIHNLTLLPGNPRRGNIPAVARSLAKFGQRKPVVARRDGTILAGNHTCEAAEHLGWTHLATVWVDDDHHTGLAYALADNRTSDLGTYDNDPLAALIAEVRDHDEELLAATSWDTTAVDELLAAIKQATPATALTDPDDAPPAPVEPITQLGDMWNLGPHTVLCGDATNTADMERLTGNDTLDIVFTDPPYGMSFGSGMRPGSPRTRAKMGMIQNDDLRGNALVALVRDALNSALPFRKPNSPAYVCFTWRTYTEFHSALTQAGMTPKACIVWDKASIGLGTLHYRPQHEFIFYVQGQWYGDKSQSDVWTLSRDRLTDYVHTTQKPVELVAKALGNSSEPGDAVLDMFGGSGTTLIAAHHTGRVARLMELDPKYVDVICRRYQQHTGTQPVLASTGKPHDFTTAPVDQ